MGIILSFGTEISDRYTNYCWQATRSSITNVSRQMLSTIHRTKDGAGGMSISGQATITLTRCCSGLQYSEQRRLRPAVGAGRRECNTGDWGPSRDRCRRGIRRERGV